MAPQHPIAVCPVHGLFSATAFAIGNEASLGIVNCVTNCPRCGMMSEIIPGIYQAELDRLNLLIDPSISLLALGAIRKLAERASAGEIDVQQAKREAEKIHPKAGRLFDIANWSDQAKATLFASLIGAVAVIAAARIASSPSQTTVINQTFTERVVTKPNEPFPGKAPQPKQPRKKRR